MSRRILYSSCLLIILILNVNGWNGCGKGIPTPCPPAPKDKPQMGPQILFCARSIKYPGVSWMAFTDCKKMIAGGGYCKCDSGLAVDARNNICADPKTCTP